MNIDLNENLGNKKKQSLRNREYYQMDEIFDNLYKQSKENKIFTKLMDYIIDERNILLAFRSIKSNKGSKTKGTDGKDIRYYENMDRGKFIKLIINKFENYFPKSVKRVEIPKNTGKIRPLGIPCMIDRIIQQCIKQVMEPICEAKFNKNSFGFRPNRGANHALARSMHCINRSQLYYSVDIDIKGFFDNVNHAKLKKQIWNLGIQDKNLIEVIRKILTSEIDGKGIPTKGTPQGGILSPLLSNIVLNELDWWLDSQWDNLKTKHKLKGSYKRYALKNSNLKLIKFVRYADDFKIFTTDYQTAKRIFYATEKWLKYRLDLDISNEKSKITNLKNNYTEFLGFKLKAVPKGNSYVCKSHMRNETKEEIIKNLKFQIKKIQRSNNIKDVHRLNAMIVGSHNYYKYASHISQDFRDIAFLVNKTLDIRLKEHMSNKLKYNETYKRLYGTYKGKTRVVKGITLFPIHGCKNVPPMQFNQSINDYTENGRKLIHDKIGGYDHIIEYLLSTENKYSTEYNDNRISLLAGQNGKCFVTNRKLNKYRMECHHKIPKSLGGSDEYNNLVWLETEIHIIIHSIKEETINKYVQANNLQPKEIKKINKLRELVGNTLI